MGAAATPVVSEAECTRAFEELEWDVSAKRRSSRSRSVSVKFKTAEGTRYSVPSAAKFTLQRAQQSALQQQQQQQQHAD